MEDQKIKQAIQKQLETVEMNPYLKNRTMDYIVRKSRKKSHHYQQIKKISLTAMTFATVMLVVLVQGKNSTNSEPQYLSENTPMTLSIEDSVDKNRSIMTETSFSQFKTMLNNLGVDYNEEAAFSANGSTIYSLLIDDEISYYVELSTDAKNEDSCSLIESILEQTNHSIDSYKVVKLDSQILFLYGGSDQALLDQLSVESNTLVCSK